MSGEGRATGFGVEEIAKDLLLLDADEEKVGPRAVLGVDCAELVRVLELSISTGCFCHISNAQGHGVPTFRTDADLVGSKSVDLRLRLAGAVTKGDLRDGDSEASMYKDAVSLLGKGQLLCLGDS